MTKIWTVTENADNGAQTAVFTDAETANAAYAAKVKKAWADLEPDDPCPDDAETAYKALCEYCGFVDTYEITEHEVDIPAPPTLFNPRLWSFLIAWHDDDHEQGEFAWSGEADSEEDALALAEEEMAESQECHPSELLHGRIIETWHGWNPWQPARDEAAHAALAKAEAFISGFEDDETQEGIGDLLASIRGAMVQA